MIPYRHLTELASCLELDAVPDHDLGLDLEVRGKLKGRFLDGVLEERRKNRTGSCCV